jgi:hypothetical protein
MTLIFRIAAMFVLAAFFINASGCCVVTYLFDPPSFTSWLSGLPEGRTADRDVYGIDFVHLTDIRMVIEDTTPRWDLGRWGAASGKDHLLVITRTTAYSDKDENLAVIPGTLRDRKIERLWITLPAPLAWGKIMKLEDLSDGGDLGFEVNNLDTKGYFRGPVLVKGIICPVAERCGMMVAQFDLEVRPTRPFRNEPWHVKGEFTIPRSKEVENRVQ